MSLKKYAVSDLIISPNDLTVLLVLESPHKDEFIHSHPAAGDTGKNLLALLKAQFRLNLFNEIAPIGCQIKSNNYKYLGIIEVSSLPMQKVFYPCHLPPLGNKITNTLDKAKIDLQKRTFKRYNPRNKIEKYLLKNFSARLIAIPNISNRTKQPNRSLIIISFGHIAHNFLNAYNNNPSNQIVFIQLPHPTAPKAQWQNASSILAGFGLISTLLP